MERKIRKEAVSGFVGSRSKFLDKTCGTPDIQVIIKRFRAGEPERKRHEMQIETERLRITALTPEQLDWWLNDLPWLEEKLNCSYQAEPLEGIFKEIVSGQLEITRQDSDNYLWHSFWLLIRKSDNVVVGSADFKNVPDEKGQVEIGYGLGKAFEHEGYMTEAVRAMCSWAKEQEGVSCIIAETEADGFASQRILKRCGFTEYAGNDTIWWRMQPESDS